MLLSSFSLRESKVQNESSFRVYQREFLLISVPKIFVWFSRLLRCSLISTRPMFFKPDLPSCCIVNFVVHSLSWPYISYSAYHITFGSF